MLAGETPRAVAKSLKLGRQSVYRMVKLFQDGGQAALVSRKAPGRSKILTDRQERQVLRWLNGKDPRQYGFDFGLWTRQLVATLVKDRLGIELSVTTVGRMLARLGVTPQKPLRRAYERDPKAVARWTKRDYPQLLVEAKRLGAEIFFLDEAGVRSDAALGRTWAPRGKTPVVATSGQRQAVNAISAVNALGAFWFATYTGRLNAASFLGFLKLFLRGRKKPIFLVVDSHPAHKAATVLRFVEATKGRLRLVFLPTYAPDLNPDEFVWNHLKTHGLAKKPLRQNESLKQRVQDDLLAIKRRPTLVRSFFHAPSTKYAVGEAA